MNPSGGWEAKLLPVMGEALRRRRHGTGRGLGHSWYITRGMRAAQGFFRSARSVVGFVPDRVTTDGHHSYRRAIRSTLETLRYCDIWAYRWSQLHPSGRSGGTLGAGSDEDPNAIIKA